ncbi:Sensor protein FixL [Gimesia maris]|uniref:sensor histidine kinase n=1 Tax=Gimesia maris TaxID=122 RepID=UPI00118D1C8C|nr:PAS domain S-box protein [Gimesia maris]QDU15080.1 Sensor protein FixL [Gimesia maris]
MIEQQSLQTSPESESRYHQLRDAVADYHYHVLLENGRIMEKQHGSKCAVITGYQPEEYIANPRLWIELVHEDDRPVIQQQIERVLSGHHAMAVEYRIRRRDGQLCWLRKMIIPYYDADGRLTAYDALLLDITEEKLAQHSLQQSEENYRLLFDDDLTGDYVASPDGEILLCNRALVEMFGFTTREQAIGSSLRGFYSDPYSWDALIERIREAGTLDRFERITRRNDGRTLHVVETVIGTFDERGNLIRLKGYVFDDTHSRVETAKLQQRNNDLEEAVQLRTREIRAERSHLEAILDSALDGIISIDNRGTIQTINRSAERLFGYARAEMIGQNVSMLMPSPYHEEHDGYLRRYLKTGERRILDSVRALVARRKDGSTFPVEVSITEVDHLQLFTGIVHDISERKQLQAHILQIAEDEQRRIGQELHDGIGQELTGLALFAGSLVEVLDAIPQKSTEETVRQLDESQFTRLRTLAERISSQLNETNIHVRQLAHGMMPVQIEPCGLQAALAELAVSIDTHPQITCHFESSANVIVADNATATHLYRIAQEAISNSLRHSLATEISITLGCKDHHVVLEMKDNGVGIHSFDHSGQANRGTGMGLRTMQYRCGLIGGTFHIEASLAGGTSVRCLVPKKLVKES